MLRLLHQILIQKLSARNAKKLHSKTDTNGIKRPFKISNRNSPLMERLLKATIRKKPFLEQQIQAANPQPRSSNSSKNEY
jgi:hypothetical protein